MIEIPVNVAHRLMAPRITYLIVSEEHPGEWNTSPISNVISVSTNPQRLVISIYNEWSTLNNICRNGIFSINILPISRETVQGIWICGGQYGGIPNPKNKKKNEAANLKFEWHGFEVPTIRESLASLICKVREKMPVGDHTMFLADIEKCYCGEPYWDKGNTRPLFDDWRPIMQASGDIFTSSSESVMADTNAATEQVMEYDRSSSENLDS